MRVLLKQTYWADILNKLTAIYKTTCVFDTNKDILATKTVIEILSVPGFVLLLVTADDGCLEMPEMASCKNDCGPKLVQFH